MPLEQSPKLSSPHTLEAKVVLSSLSDTKCPVIARKATRSILSKMKSLGIVLSDAKNKASLLAHRRCSSLAEISTGGLGFGDTLGENGGVFALFLVRYIWMGWGQMTYGSILGSLSVTALQCNAVTLVLETLRGDQSLDLGSLGVWLLALALRLDFTTNDKLADL